MSIERIHFTATEGTSKALDELAQEKRRSRSAQICELIEPHITKLRKKPARKTGKK